MRACVAWAIAIVIVLAALPRPVAADETELAQSKRYFSAGAAAYELGDYLAAIQALDAAFRLTPLPAIAFSLAQAERRQYFVSHEPAHLQRAIELYRGYLQQVATGGRRADATDALAQLELLALSVAPVAGDTQASDALAKTRVMITCTAPSAQIVLDGGAPAASPLIAQVEAGVHRVAVTAPGFFPEERGLDAVAGALVPLEIALRARPARVVLHVEPEAELQVDGAPLGRLGADRQLELSGGEHRFVFARAGYHVKSVAAGLASGSERRIAVDLEPTAQRTAAFVSLATSGASLVVASVFTGLAIDRERFANDFLKQRTTSNVSAAELRAYTHAVERRDQYRTVATAGFAVAGAALVAAVCLYLLDQPDLSQESLAPAGSKPAEPSPAPHSDASARTGALDGVVRF